MPDAWEQSWNESRARLAATHDAGADEALRLTLTLDTLPVECMTYCYGGSARPDITEILADLADAGWRLVHAESKKTTIRLDGDTEETT